MIYLVLSILISSLIFVVFKLFEVYRINTLHAIVANYIIASITGLLNYKEPIDLAEIPGKPWFWGCVALGGLFIAVFNVMALTSQRNGLSVASVAGKMSVVIPVVFGVWAYNETVGIIKVGGIILALVAVYLTSVKQKGALVKKGTLLLPVLLFLGSGIIDASIKFIETRYVEPNGIPIFSATVFACAAIIGIVLLIAQVVRGTFRFNFKNIIGGIALGVPNYYSIYFLLRALQTDGLESSTLFTINNVAIVMLTTLFGLWLFKEKLITKNWIGIGLAIVSIIVVTIA